MLQVYLVTFVGVVLGQMVPGPNLLAVANAALGQGKVAAFYVAFGVATAIFMWVTVTAFGLASLFVVYPSLLVGMKIFGGGYLCFVAVKSMESAIRNKKLRFDGKSAHWSPFSSWRKGFLVNASNPKSALMWGAMTTFMFGGGLSTVQVLVFAPIGFLSAILVYGAYAWLFSTSAAKGLYGRFSSGFQMLFGTLFGVVGGGLLYSGIRDLAAR